MSRLERGAAWVVVALGMLACRTVAWGQTTFFDPGTIQKIEIWFSQPDWDYRMDTAKAGNETYLPADSVRINGIRYDSVGVKYKGNSSYNASQVKNPLNLGLDEYDNQSHEGVTTIKLGNGYGDPSLIREVLAYGMLQNYMHCPRSNFAQVYVNGSYIGLYSNAKNIDKDFCSDHFLSSTGTFFKCNPVVTPSPTLKSNLKTIPGDSTGYFQRYELKSDMGWNALVDLCDVVTTNTGGLDAAMDMDRVAWMLAFNDVMVNLDSYSGVFCQNYYLYRDQTGRFNPIIWDLNMCYGGFPFLGSGNTSLGSLTIPNMEQLPVDIHGTDPYWPLINAVMADARWRKMYHAHLRTMAEEMIGSGSYLATAATLQATIDTAVASDVNKFFSYTDFQNGMTAAVQNGSYQVPGIQSLMDARWAYLQGTAPFTATQPTIGTPVATPAVPSVGGSVTITAQVGGADSVFLGWRLAQSARFQRIPMHDDGTHGDGAAGDGLYGASFTFASTDAQYYIYAEDADMGAFSPARAEHEFHALQAALSLPNPGDIKVNEFVASNQTGQVNEYGQYADWMEFYNTTASPLALDGLYLSDDPLLHNKWQFPSGSSIGPHGVLVVWADEQPSTGSYLHANFKLSGQGELIVLSDGGSVVLDSAVFGPQTVDRSMGRCPDGTGSLQSISAPTFDALNCPAGEAEAADGQVSLLAFPNPADGSITFAVTGRHKGDLEVWDALGKQIVKDNLQGSLTLDLHAWKPGVYLARIGGTSRRFVVVH